MKKISFVLPKGFKSAGISSGIKKTGKRDLGLIYSSKGCFASAAFTKNKIKAYPIKICQENINNQIYAVIANSGNANCFTGGNGLRDIRLVIKALSRELRIKDSQILIASTGIIGVQFPYKKIIANIPQLINVLSFSGGESFAQAILTTDTFVKKISVSIDIGGKEVVISGFAKGAGMIYPDLEVSKRHATMLCFILTDASIKKSFLDKALEQSLGDSFNAISIDGCMSTNDTALVLSNGLAQNRVINKNDSNFYKFEQGLNFVCVELAKMIVSDGEGATKFIKINVEKAKNYLEAKKAAQAIANSNLFKCTIYGQDPNWGRIAAAMGSEQISFKEEKLDIFFNDKAFVLKGRPQEIKSKEQTLKNKNVEVKVILNSGKFDFCLYTCDLTPKYVNINAAYN